MAGVGDMDEAFNDADNVYLTNFDYQSYIKSEISMTRSHHKKSYSPYHLSRLWKLLEEKTLLVITQQSTQQFHDYKTKVCQKQYN